MKILKKSLAVFLAVLCLFSALSVTSFAATKYKSYDGKYGLMIPVKSNYKTQCKSYDIKEDKGLLNFKFDSKGKDNTYFGFTIYSDEERQNIIINKNGSFPKVDSKGSLTIDFSKLESGTYYGLTFTYIQKDGDLIIDKDSIYQFEINLNKIANVTPKIIEAQALYSGNYIKWKKVAYADYYRVYRKQEGTDYEIIADVTNREYTDKTVEKGEKYIYTIRAFDEDSYSKRNKNGVDLIYLAPPKFAGTPETLEDNKIKISWKEVKGAKKYRIYRKTEDAKKYTRLATVAGDVLDYTDKTSKKDGETYVYAVKAVNGTNAGVISAKNKITLFGVKKPIASCVGETVTVKWDPVENATDYKLFKKNADDQWDLVYSGTDSFEYVDTDVSTGNKYNYSLIVEKDGQYSSFDTKGVTAYCLAEPKITTIKASVDNSVYLKWDEIEGATKYNIYRESPFEDYKLVGTTTKTSFYDKTEKDSNYFYTYYVEAANEYGAGVSGNNMRMYLYMRAPELVSVKWNSGNVVKWKRVPGATSYKIYRKTPNGSYKEIAEVTDVLSYKDKTAKKSSKYYYTVTAMNGKYEGAYESGIGVNV